MRNDFVQAFSLARYSLLSATPNDEVYKQKNLIKHKPECNACMQNSTVCSSISESVFFTVSMRGTKAQQKFSSTLLKMNDKRLFIMPLHPAQSNRANTASAYFELKFLQYFQSPFARNTLRWNLPWTAVLQKVENSGKKVGSNVSNSGCWSKAMCVNDTECTAKQTTKSRNSLNYIVLIIFCVTTNLSDAKEKCT